MAHIARGPATGTRTSRFPVHLTTHPDPAAFLASVGPELERSEAEHSLLLGVALAPESWPSPTAYLASVRYGDVLALAALMTPPRPLVLSSDHPEPGEALGAVARQVMASGLPVHGVVLPTRWSQRFVEEWRAAGGSELRVSMRQRLHVLRETLPVPIPPGRLRPATADDVELVGDWIFRMHREALGEGHPAAGRATAERRIAAGEIFVWDDGRPRSMAARARPTRRTVSVNEVYTPPDGRGQGYASACVATLTERLLADGYEQCVLFTDLANPTSNRIYARIGYQPCRDFHFLRPEAAGR